MIVRGIEAASGNLVALKLLMWRVQGFEWQLSEKDAEIAAARERLELVEQRQGMEVHNLTESLQVLVTTVTTAAMDVIDALVKTVLFIKLTQMKLLHTAVAYRRKWNGLYSCSRFYNVSP